MQDTIDYDFDEDGQLIIAGQLIDHATLGEILDKYFDGCCPVCNTEIPDGAIACDDCLRRAQHYREQHGGG